MALVQGGLGDPTSPPNRPIPTHKTHDDNDEIEGLSPAPLGCGLCFAGKGGGRRGREGRGGGDRAAEWPLADPPGRVPVPTTGRPSWTLLL